MTKKSNKKDIESICKKFAEADKMLAQANKDLKYLNDFTRRFEKLTENIETLVTFYTSDDWLDGRNELFDKLPDEVYHSAGEDSIWDAIQEFYCVRIKILKQITDTLHKEIERRC